MSISWRVLVLLVIVVGWGGIMTKNEAASGVEICDNGIDDDNDGLVDINDPDCTCHANGDTLLFASSLIPNSSFEDRYCCPTNIAQLSCAKNWIQASDATTDYFHTCGYMGDVFRSIPPKPYPAGNGFVAFRDEDDYKEYTGACLNSPLLDGVEYRLQFYVGFGKPGQVWGSKSPFHLSIFGAKYCSDLPFGIPGQLYSDCPMGLPNWIQIADTYVAGNDEWVKVTLDFTVNQDIEVIAIGPSCDKVRQESYYFLDGLQLAEKKSFDVKKLEVKADMCNEEVILTAPSFPNVTYQWYKDGVALLNATSNTYKITSSPESDYRVRLMINGECLVTDSYHYKYLKNTRTMDTLVCENDVLNWENQTIDKEGQYTVQLQNKYGCDSTIILNVKHLPIAHMTVDTMLCEGETLDLHGQRYSDPGVYELKLTNGLGCDSLVEVNLGFHPVYHTKIDTSICEGESILIGKEELSKEGTYAFNLVSGQDCDSMLDVTLKIIPPSTMTLDTAVCATDSVAIGGKWFKTPGSYEIHLNSVRGCDSVIYFNLTKFQNYYLEMDTSICYGDRLVIDGKTMDATGKYLFHYNSVDGCDSTFQVNLIVMPEMVSTLNEITPISCNGEQDASIDALPSGGDGNYSYEWNTGENSSKITGKAAGHYEVTITDGMGCSIVENIDIVQPDVLESELEIQKPTCLDPEGGRIQVNTIIGGTAPYSISINGTPTTISQLNAQLFSSGTYDVEVVDAHGCLWSEGIEFLEPGLGSVDLLTNQTELKRGQSIKLQVDIQGLALPLKQIKWTPASIVSCQNCMENTFVMDRSNVTIEVEITDSDNCIYTRSVPFKSTGKFFIPNVFSPNGDGVNDVFQVLTDDEDAIIRELRIFDRWGDVVFFVQNRSVIDPDAGWDGSFKTRPMAPGAFVYTAEIEDQLGQIHRMQGTITLIR